MTKLEWKVDKFGEAEAYTKLFWFRVTHDGAGKMQWFVAMRPAINVVAESTATTLHAAQEAAVLAARVMLREELEKLG